MIIVCLHGGLLFFAAFSYNPLRIQGFCLSEIPSAPKGLLL
nr:MAG TPA: hypothetical protein [Caudoviricetes sp.]